MDGIIQASSVSCPSANFCVVVGFFGNAVTYNGTSWSSPSDIDGNNFLISVSCPSASFCAGVDDDGDTLTYNGTLWSSPSHIDGFYGLTSVSCPSASFCAAVDGAGNAFTYNGHSWSAPSDIGSSEFPDLPSVSCPSASFCVAVDQLGNAFTYNGSSWSSLSDIDGSNRLTSVSCATASFCFAVDAEGNALTYTSTPPPVQSNDAVTLRFGSAPGYGPQSPVAPGTTLSLEAKVNPNGVANPGTGGTAPTGTVSFYDNGSTVPFATVPINDYEGSGYASDITTGLSPGSHEITAIYNGDSRYLSAISNQVQVTVLAGVTSPATATPTEVGLNFGSAPTYTEQSPVPAGNNEIFTATVSSNGVVNPGPSVSAPTGTVSFYDGATLLGTNSVTGYEGSAYVSLSTTVLSAGSHEITAVYGGDATHPASTSNQVQVTVS
jgi:hypothetical protein